MESISTMPSWTPRLVLETELSKIETRLVADSTSPELQFERAILLRELGRTDEAKQAYLELLAKEPTHFGALNNLGTLALETGYQTAARTAYAEAIKHHPHQPMGHINLANALARIDDFSAARRHFKMALQLDPDNTDAHQGLARILSEAGNHSAARIHQLKGFQSQPTRVLPYRGTVQPIKLLVLAAAEGGAVPIWHHLDDTMFLTTVLYVDFWGLDQTLPVHDLIFNAIGDADLCQSALSTAAILIQKSTAKVINKPSNVMNTGRVNNSQRFLQVPGVTCARMALLTKQELGNSALLETLAAHRLSFPLLLRTPGFHNGNYFERVLNNQELSRALGELPGEELLAIQFLDARSGDGKIRKYRVMLIDGEIYPLHVAISHEWKIHFVTAEMADDSDNRAEDAAFLENMPRVLGPQAMMGLATICQTLQLDYAGVDFSVGGDGNVILFEANATMVVNPPDPDAKWDYRRPAVQRILDAIRELLTKNDGSEFVTSVR